MRTLTLLLLLFGGLSLAVAVSCDQSPTATSGRALAETYCANCHQLPDPGDLTRDIWLSEVLPKMGAMYGMYGLQPRSYFLENDKVAPYLKQVYPADPRLAEADWALIQSYYLDNAPERLAGSNDQAGLQQTTQFRVHELPETPLPGVYPYATLVRFDPVDRLIYVGGPGRNGGQLHTFSADHRHLGQRPINEAPSDYDPRRQLVLAMGNMLPSDLPRGSVDDLGSGRRWIDSLARPVAFQPIDLDLDGTEEWAVAEYGNMLGYLNLYAEVDSTLSLLTTLSSQPGALRLRRADLDGDGHDDLLVLNGQGDESIVCYYARPGGAERKRLLRFPPSYGSSDLRVIDFDRDGDLDLLYTNGDNFDYQPIPKPYHGLRIFLNDGAQNFTEAYFYPMDGAYGIAVDDFDGDEDYDVALIAYFVPPAQRAYSGFAYLEQTAPLSFAPSGFTKQMDQHFLTMDKGDVDGDGDPDLLIGNFAAYLPDGLRGSGQGGDETLYLWLENRQGDVTGNSR